MVSPLYKSSSWAQDPEECQKQLKKKQKNRVAAQRSRQKHTDRADALHQQHESLEKHNQALRKEIQDLQAELAQWSQTLQLHEHLCPKDCVPYRALEPPECWGQARWLPGQHSCLEQPDLFSTPVSCLSAQLYPDPQPQGPCGLPPSPLSLLSLGPATVTLPPAQTSLSHLPSASSTAPSLPGSSPLPSPPAQATSPQPLGQVPPSKGELGSSLGPEYLQSREHKASPSAADWPGSALDLDHHPLLVFPLVASAQVRF
ncbi:basic leucine zipper transcriptional factor ATF-like 2 isoform X3 [Cavia porcellus]|uniref:basic leucine zipper transcriptional factor ATF-like 2 isoform X3 n=1 Tax=Cavia porcellus TaxID=10141 RepID=UPI002FE3A70D